MNTQENNKLIAEFMGLVKSSYRNMYWTEKAKEGFGEGELVNLLYHTSWDWLMPVVENIKILVMEDDSDELYNSEEWDNITHTLVQIEIKSVYKAVVEFIKQYNENERLNNEYISYNDAPYGQD